MRGVAWSLVLVVIALTASVNAGILNINDGRGNGRGNGHAYGQGSSATRREDPLCRIRPEERVEVAGDLTEEECERAGHCFGYNIRENSRPQCYRKDVGLQEDNQHDQCTISRDQRVDVTEGGDLQNGWTRDECENAGHCFANDDGRPQCFRKGMLRDQEDFQEYECTIPDGAEPTRVHRYRYDFQKSACLLHHCYSELMAKDGKKIGCYRKRDDRCTVDPSKRIYLNQAWTFHDCEDRHRACWGVDEQGRERCYMKANDMCNIEAENRRYINKNAMGTDHADNEKICLGANSCYDYTAQKCYLKDIKCISVPQMCEIVENDNDECSAECGLGEHTVTWNCDGVDFSFKNPCCKQTCEVTADSVPASPSDFDDIEPNPYTGIKVMENGPSMLPDGRIFSRCAQILMPCHENVFHQHETTGRNYFLEQH